ncbi:PAQR family membrane homeostasis protein TrhA [Loigolactobacillus zhaoyuanensis]|uniref:Hemolysin III family protein n=1 Tax=Loigolactobacillus zhaoyuanensis TaxID=2486017 RepID=A0ABW8UD41_9LACO|nr:hemolysin III family protein [Loigolactobacillus zhaoyuanensis]
MTTNVKHQVVVIEIWNAITHGVGFIASVAMFVLLVRRGLNAPRPALLALTIYGLTLMLLYLASTLYHCLSLTRARRVFQIFDHCNIFLLIAGTYTPYCLLAIKGSFGLWMCLAIWGLALAGIALHIFSGARHQKLETTIYVVMGWLCLMAMGPLYTHLGTAGFSLLVAGGVTFTLGALIYSFPKTPYLHLIWHFFVMLGTTLMFCSIYWFI